MKESYLINPAQKFLKKMISSKTGTLIRPIFSVLILFISLAACSEEWNKKGIKQSPNILLGLCLIPLFWRME